MERGDTRDRLEAWARDHL